MVALAQCLDTSLFGSRGSILRGARTGRMRKSPLGSDLVNDIGRAAERQEKQSRWQWVLLISSPRMWLGRVVMQSHGVYPTPFFRRPLGFGSRELRIIVHFAHQLGSCHA